MTTSKHAAAVALLASKGIGPWEAAPPLHRLLWRCGIAVPPPHFCGFWFNASLMGAVFGPGWGLIMWLFYWSHKSMPVPWCVAAAGLSGVTFGLFMAAVYLRDTSMCKLPSWREFSEKGNT
jgi:hypothetical protein